MRPTLYGDEYGLVDIAYLVYAFPLNPWPEPLTEPQEWSIALLLHVGTKARRAMLTYPTRAHRDQAFEAICTLATAVASQETDHA
jgi:hypothetical protein